MLFGNALAVTMAMLMRDCGSRLARRHNGLTLVQSIVLHLKMFFIVGDPYFRYNVAGRPYFTWPEGILLLIGIGVAAFA